MVSLGEFGSAKAALDPDRERDTISLCGVEFPVADRINPLAILKFGEVAAAGVEGESPEGMKAMLALIRNAVEVEDWPRFEATVDKHRPTIEVLMELSMAVIQRETGRPTERPSDSSDGSSATTESSKAPLSSEASSGPKTWRDSPFGKRELAVHPELYADVLPMGQAARQVAELAG